jgi:cytochrome c peroxidase
MFAALAGAAVGAGGFYYWKSLQDGQSNGGSENVDYQKVYNEIAKVLEEGAEKYDDGSFGPVLVRLAWHASGTYCNKTKTGGSYFGTMRFEPEAKHGANNGLQVAREKLEPIKKKFPNISYGDLWTLAGVAAIQEMGGPIIPWRPGRVDGTAADCPPEGRLPDGANPSPQHPRDIFYRMGFNDQEIVALIGAHTLGRCHADRSGFDGPWTDSPTTFSNSYFVEILGRTWVEKKWTGPKQFADKESGNLMMLPADMAFVKDKEFKKWVETYAKDEEKFFNDFAAAWKKLLELGVPFSPQNQEIKFKPVSA